MGVRWPDSQFWIYILDSDCVLLTVTVFLTSSPRQEKLFIWPPSFQYHKRLLRQKTGGACLYMPQDGHWLASFEDQDITPPPKKVSFPAAKKI